MIDGNTGTLSFQELPDCENPCDADHSNNYTVLWQILSSLGKARSQFVIIQATNLPEQKTAQAVEFQCQSQHFW